MLIAAGLTKSNTIQKAVGHLSKRKYDADLPVERRKLPAPSPVPDVRYDNFLHRPKVCEKNK